MEEQKKLCPMRGFEPCISRCAWRLGFHCAIEIMAIAAGRKTQF